MARAADSLSESVVYVGSSSAIGVDSEHTAAIPDALRGSGRMEDGRANNSIGYLREKCDWLDTQMLGGYNRYSLNTLKNLVLVESEGQVQLFAKRQFGSESRFG